MDRITYEVESRVEESHWWFVGRRRLLAGRIGELGFSKDAAILDVGTSTGTNLRMLRALGFTNYEGLDVSDEAIRWCAQKNIGIVRKGDVCCIPAHDKSFDLVLATDILEHVYDDETALREIGRVLKHSGKVIITVPAFPWLWGLQDVVANHKRRYRRGELEAKLGRAGFIIRRLFYFNYVLLVPIWIARQILRVFKVRLGSENELNSALVNSICGALFTLDVSLAKWLRCPFGVSLYVEVEKTSTKIIDGQ
jgi:SAM-dependent methyltransferase